MANGLSVNGDTYDAVVALMERRRGREHLSPSELDAADAAAREDADNPRLSSPPPRPERATTMPLPYTSILHASDGTTVTVERELAGPTKVEIVGDQLSASSMMSEADRLRLVQMLEEAANLAPRT